MEKRTTTSARALATLALAGAFIVVIAVLGTSLGGGGGSSSSSSSGGGTAREKVTLTTGGGGRKVTAAYVVQNGDTLTSIAHKTGVSVVRIQSLNPGIDPQILVSGQKLKLR